MAELKDLINKGRKEFKTEEGNKASIKLLPMTKGIIVAQKLLNIVAPSIGSIADGLRHDEMLHGVSRSFSDLAMVLCQQLDKVDILELINTLLEDLWINTSPVDMDEYFMANYSELAEILEFALRENFETFFTGKGIKARLVTVVKNLLQDTTMDSSDQE